MRLIFLKNLKLSPISFGPFNAFDQKRWRKHANTARTRLDNRPIDTKLNSLISRFNKLGIALHLFDLMSKRNRTFVSLQTMSHWVNVLGLNIRVSEFVKKYPRLFEVFQHPVTRRICCKGSGEMVDLIEEEKRVLSRRECENVRVLKKIFMLSKKGTLHVHALWLVRRELGLPEDFRDSILRKYSEEFTFVDKEVVRLVKWDESLAIAEIELWREKEYTEKWLRDCEVRYAFPINFPTGFKIEAGFKGRLREWQRLCYRKPYEKGGRSRTAKCFEKRVIAIVHELLSLTVEKVMPLERFSHFRKDLGIEVNMRELLLKHPGIFYISIRGNVLNVFLREAYRKGRLIEPNEVSVVRRKLMDLMLMCHRNTEELTDLMLMGHRNTEELTKDEEHNEEEEAIPETDKVVGSRGVGDWIIPLLERSDD